MKTSRDGGRCLLLKGLAAAFEGRRLWVRLKKEYGIGANGYTIFFPEGSKEDMIAVFSLLGRFAKEKGVQGFFIIFTGACCAEEMAQYPFQAIGSVTLTQQESHCLLKFYALYAFHSRFIVASLHLPHGRLAYRMLGVNGMTVYDLYFSFVFSLPLVEGKE